MSTRTANSVVTCALLVSSLVAVGCGSSRAAYAPRASVDQVASRPSHADPDRVEVLLDSEPSRPFTVVGELQARRIESPASISAMQSRAAEEGLDGIYWIDCSKGAKVCTSKGFVYDKASPAMPEINARVAASDSKPIETEAVAHR